MWSTKYYLGGSCDDICGDKIKIKKEEVNWFKDNVLTMSKPKVLPTTLKRKMETGKMNAAKMAKNE